MYVEVYDLYGNSNEEFKIEKLLSLESDKKKILIMNKNHKFNLSSSSRM